MDYTHVVTRFPQLCERLVSGDGAFSMDESAEDKLARSVPTLISILAAFSPTSQTLGTMLPSRK